MTTPKDIVTEGKYSSRSARQWTSPNGTEGLSDAKEEAEVEDEDEEEEDDDERTFGGGAESRGERARFGEIVFSLPPR